MKLRPLTKERTKWVKGVGRVHQPHYFEKDGTNGVDGHLSDRTPRMDFAGGDDSGVLVGRRRPETDLQALMEAAPGDRPEPSEEAFREERYRKADIVTEALEDPWLTDLERLVLQLKHYGGKSYRDQEAILRTLRENGMNPHGAVAKSYLQRVAARGEEKLRELLAQKYTELYPPQTLEGE